MTDNFFLLLGSAVAIFLTGVNVAFLLQMGGNLVGWFKFKIFAVGLLLVYVAYSFSYGGPSLGRVCVGWAALLIDLTAIFWMWASIEEGRKTGRLGLVPLLNVKSDSEEEDGDRAV